MSMTDKRTKWGKIKAKKDFKSTLATPGNLLRLPILEEHSEFKDPCP